MITVPLASLTTPQYIYVQYDVPLSPVVEGWGLAVGDAMMSDRRRSFGVIGGGSAGGVGGAEVQAAVFKSVVLHGVTTGHVFPKLLEFGGAQSSCNRVTKPLETYSNNL